MAAPRQAILLVLPAAMLVALAGVPLGRWLDPVRRLPTAGLTRRPPFVVPAFSFRDRDGHGVSDRDLRGRPWVAGFVLATCGRTSAAVVDALGAIAGQAPDLRIVTFSLDGGGSTGGPPVGEPWRRLTADSGPLFRFAGAMGLGASEADVSDGLAAPTRWLFLVDEEGVVRTTWDAFTAPAGAPLAAAVAAVRPSPAREVPAAPPAAPAAHLDRGDWPVPAFSYRDQDDHRLTDRDLLGHPWIADFVFTRCAGPCPVMTARLGELRRRLPSARLRFVSFSVDPEHDTPAVLKAYAAHFGGNADGRWRLLSTNWPTIGPLAGAMHAVVLAADATGASTDMIVHSDRFVLVDAAGQARAAVDSADPEGLDWLVAAAMALDENTNGHRFGLSGPVPYSSRW